MNLEQKVGAIEGEMTLMKGEIKQTLVDLREFIMKQGSPFVAGGGGGAISQETLDQILEQAQSSMRAESTASIQRELEDMRRENQRQLESMKAAAGSDSGGSAELQRQIEELRRQRQQQIQALQAQQTAGGGDPGASAELQREIEDLRRQSQRQMGQMQDLQAQTSEASQAAASVQRQAPQQPAQPQVVQVPAQPQVIQVQPPTPPPAQQVPVQPAQPAPQQQPHAEQQPQEPPQGQQVQQVEAVQGPQEQPARPQQKARRQQGNVIEVPAVPARQPQQQPEQHPQPQAPQRAQPVQVPQRVQPVQAPTGGYYEQPTQGPVVEPQVQQAAVPGPSVGYPEVAYGGGLIGAADQMQEEAALDANLLASLLRWVGGVKRRLGGNQLPGFLEMYKLTGHLPPPVERLILHIAELDALPDESSDQVFTLDDVMDALLQLHAVVYGPGHAFRGSLTDIAGGPESPEEYPEDTEPDG